MNAAANIIVETTSPEYHADGYGWAMAQLKLIRERRFEEVDWEHVAREIEDMSRSEYRSLESALRVLLVHLLKWDHQVAFRSRSWLITIREQHRQYRRLLDQSPSLRPHLEQIRADAYLSAVRDAVKETGLALASFPAQPLGWNVIENPPPLGEDFAGE